MGYYLFLLFSGVLLLFIVYERYPFNRVEFVHVVQFVKSTKRVSLIFAWTAIVLSVMQICVILGTKMT